MKQMIDQKPVFKCLMSIFRLLTFRESSKNMCSNRKMIKLFLYFHYPFSLIQ